jgi:hypothetical protein
MRYIYRVEPGDLPRFLPLLWREREVQANMVVLDDGGRNLVYLPSETTLQIARATINQMWRDFHGSLAANATPVGVATPQPLLDLASFEPNEQQKQAANALLQSLARTYHGNAELVRLRQFARRLAVEYVPFLLRPIVAISDPFLFVRQGVDVYAPIVRGPHRRTRSELVTSYSYPELVLFLMFGLIHFEVPLPLLPFTAPPWFETDSVHLRAILPNGLKVRNRLSGEIKVTGVPSELFENLRLLEFASADDNNLYVYVARAKADEIQKFRDVIRVNTRASVRDAFEDASATRRRFLDVGKSFAKPLYEPRSDRPADLRDLIAAIWKLSSGMISILRARRKYVRARERLRIARQPVQEASRPVVVIKAGLTPGFGTMLVLLWLTVALGLGVALQLDFSVSNFLGAFSALLVVILSMTVYSVGRQYLREVVAAHASSSAAVFALVLLLRLLRGP